MIVSMLPEGCNVFYNISVTSILKTMLRLRWKHSTVILIWTAAVVVLCKDAVGQTQPEKPEIGLSPRLRPLLELRNNATTGDVFHHSKQAIKWATLTSGTREIIRFMICHGQLRGPIHRNPKTLVFIHTEEIPWFTNAIEHIFSCPEEATKVVVWQLGILCRRKEVLNALTVSLDIEEDIKSVIVSSSDVNCLQFILNIVATDSDFKWRRFLHATEWFALTIDFLPSRSTHIDKQNLPDFVTFLFIADRNQTCCIHVMQKSRIQQIKTVISMPFPFNYRPYKTGIVLDHRTNQTFPNGQLRKDADQYLLSQKSVMVDMQIPIVLLSMEQIKLAYIVRDGNQTSWHGFYVKLTDLLCEALGFTALPFPVTDGGFISDFQSSDDVKGLVGYLKRREAGLSTMAIVSNRRRRRVVDFVYPHIMETSLYIVYKVHYEESQLGDPRSELIDTKTDLIFLLIGPCVFVVVGIFIFLVSGVLLTKRKVCGWENLRRLYDFPLRWVFQTTSAFFNPVES
ncbi:hypothetical protein ElyMa_004240700 [Elysia marginata]|uniref:Ionotropic glutamate receptor L-glutamate and glycine-binding domain-containing protein n=1 Tax=Elysia marginata TaxID=1093978 RepID=A0AAV4GR40_9GAST|nr:hypothetical protein ElyMa_004240700 [Elysia marginata]